MTSKRTPKVPGLGLYVAVALPTLAMILVAAFGPSEAPTSSAEGAAPARSRVLVVPGAPRHSPTTTPTAAPAGRSSGAPVAVAGATLDRADDAALHDLEVRVAWLQLAIQALDARLRDLAPTAGG